jgi:P4 family phage/plasmid primase-like protien
MTTVENNAGKSGATNSISQEDLIKLHKLGFKLLPLDEHGKPVMPWGEIYENPNYWTPEKLSQESYKFKNVATVFGKTHLKDDKGELYLNCLDVDSEESYKKLFNLRNGEETYNLLEVAQKTTYVTKTKKPYGRHIYWLSHQQNKPIHTTDCIQGYEFEIKTDKSAGHATLPPRNHREDFKFHYKNFGLDIKLVVSDGICDEIMTVLSGCLMLKREDQVREDKQQQQQIIELSDSDIKEISEALNPFYKKGSRNYLVLALCGLLRRWNVSKESAIDLLQILTKDDEERRSRIETLESTYKMDPEKVAGVKFFQNIIGVDASKDVLHTIFHIIRGKEESDLILWLATTVMSEYVFVTATDNEDMYWYDNEKGVYLAGQQWRINELCQVIYPKIRTRELNEVINQLKRRTYEDRSKFDTNPDILNLRNGLLNIHTGEFKEHSSDHLSLIQLPVIYGPYAKCPNILRFLGQVLKPKDVFTALQLFGYSIYKTAKYEKAVMCVGKGDNGKTTLLKLFECFLGLKNVSHASLQELNGDKFAIADLHGKSANICADLKSKKLTNTGVFKMLVSGDVIRAQKKHGQPFDFSNYAKLIYSANQIPQSDDITYAYFKRWIILIFDRVFMGEEKDTNLIEQLTTDGELSGLLNLALIALRQLISDNGFIYTDDIRTVEREYNLNANTVEGFLTEKCSMDTSERGSFGICRDIYHTYVLYCKENKITPLSDNSFGIELAQKHIKKERKMVNGSREYCYIGIKHN